MIKETTDSSATCTIQKFINTRSWSNQMGFMSGGVEGLEGEPPGTTAGPDARRRSRTPFMSGRCQGSSAVHALMRSCIMTQQGRVKGQNEKFILRVKGIKPQSDVVGGGEQQVHAVPYWGGFPIQINSPRVFAGSEWHQDHAFHLGLVWEEPLTQGPASMRSVSDTHPSPHEAAGA